jgi:DivIVA domain-containing protein
MGKVNPVAQIRQATFTHTRRGYDRREVDNYLSKLADWLEGGGADQDHRQIVKRELDRVVEKTGQILTAAEEAAQALRAEAGEEARRIVEQARVSAESSRAAANKHAQRAREEADAVAARVRADADGHAKRVRREADEHAKRVQREADADAKRVRREADAEAAEAVSQAEARAIRMVEEATRRRREIEKVIADLETRREAVVRGLEKLSSQLAGAANEGMLARETRPPAPTRQ